MYLDTAATKRIVHSKLYVPLIAPGGVPRVLNEPVVQASGFIGAITNSQHAVVEWVKRFFGIEAIKCINDAAGVLMYVFIISRNSDGNRLFLNGSLQLGLIPCINDHSFLDPDVGGLGCRVKAVV